MGAEGISWLKLGLSSHQKKAQWCYTALVRVWVRERREHKRRRNRQFQLSRGRSPRSMDHPSPIQWPISSHPMPCSDYTLIIRALEPALLSDLLQLHPSTPSPKFSHQQGALRQQGWGVREQGIIFLLKINVSESPESQKCEEAL